MLDNLQTILFEGENVLWMDKPNKFCYVWHVTGKLIPIAIIWAIFDGAFIATFLSNGVGGGMTIFLLGFFALHLFPVWKMIGSFIRANLEHKNVIYAITDKRVIIRTGIVGLDYENINYTDIANISVNVSVLEKIMGVGTVEIKTSSGKSVLLISISNPYEIYKKVNKVFMDIKSDIHFPNAYRPDLNPGYNTKYNGE